MSNYESTVIFMPDLSTEKINELTDKIKKTAEQAGATIKHSENLGKKKLSYKINKVHEGVYFYMELTAPGEVVKALETFYKVHDPILRYLTVKVVKKKTPPKVEAPVQPVPAGQEAIPGTPAPAAPAAATAPAVEPAPAAPAPVKAELDK